MPSEHFHASAAPEWISTKEAAFRLNVSADTILRWASTGMLTALQPGPGCAVLVSAADADALRTRRYPLRPPTSTAPPAKPARRKPRR